MTRSILIVASLIMISVPVYASQDLERGESPVSSARQGDDGQIWKDISNYRGWKIGTLLVTGLEQGKADNLKSGLELGEEDAVLYERILLRDVERIRLFLALRGYPYSRVSAAVSPLDKKREIDLALDIDSGPPVVIEEMEIIGLPEEFRDSILERMNSTRGAIFTEEALADDEATLLETLMDAGHARATSGFNVEMIDTVSVRIIFELFPGAVYYFDRFSASGANEDLNDLALIALNIRRGERFRPKTVTDARDNLSNLQLFRQIRISLEDTAPDSLEMVVELSERKHRVLELAGGYWSDDGLSARIRWRHANLFKKGRGSSFELSYTQYKQSGRWVSWWPALFKARLLGTLRIGYDNLDEESFEKTSPGIGIGISYAHTRTMKSSIGYVIEWASYKIKTTEKEYFEDPEGPIGFFFYRIIRDGTDDRINPTRGIYSWLRLEYGPEGGISNSNYFISELSSTAHIPLSSRTGFAANLHLGWGTPITPSTILLPDKRFYAGGSITHRGFERRKLGPLDENGLPLGGEVMATAFVEFRFPFFWKFNGAAFVDAGQVWRTRGDFTWDNIEIAVGPAVRIMTPVGPLRFDLGYRLTDCEPSQPEYAFHFAIGYPM
jgi:outer membrane protein insertion porin family